MSGGKKGLMARLAALLERKKTERAAPAGESKAPFESWMPVAPDTEKLQAAWRLMAAYGAGIREIRGELVKAKRAGDQKDADSLEFVLGLHENAYQKLASCFQSMQVNEDYRTSNEFEIVAAEAVKLLDDKYWPQEFIAAQFDGFNFLLERLCARCEQKGGDAASAGWEDALAATAQQNGSSLQKATTVGKDLLPGEGFDPEITREVLPDGCRALRMYVKEKLKECRAKVPLDKAAPERAEFERASGIIDSMLADFLPPHEEQKLFEGRVAPELNRLCKSCGVSTLDGYEQIIASYFERAYDASHKDW